MDDNCRLVFDACGDYMGIGTDTWKGKGRDEAHRPWYATQLVLSQLSSSAVGSEIRLPAAIRNVKYFVGNINENGHKSRI